MDNRQEFLDKFEERWPGWRSHVEEMIDYSERTGEGIFFPGLYELAPSSGKMEATIYNGSKAPDRFIWPFQDPLVEDRNMLISKYMLTGGLDG